MLLEDELRHTNENGRFRLLQLLLESVAGNKHSREYIANYDPSNREYYGLLPSRKPVAISDPHSAVPAPL
jgi:hypothetical protein